ncbi:MAG: hypothetical protein LQ339_001262 [Xanthoria mediterranea]|nr:MAG: hypothetical protein LQ339_001262 [Xanthoria mediterranea]
MTAVVSPSSVQPHSQWNPGDAGRGLHSMNADDVTRMFMPRRSAQRTNSSSSTSSTAPSSSSSSTTFTIPVPPPQPNGEIPITNGEQAAGAIRKKPQRGLWPSSKAEPGAGLSNGQTASIPTPSSGQSAASTMSTMHQSSPILPSQTRSSSQQQPNGSRIEQSSAQTDAPAVLALQPLTGTFERKQINVPFFPDVLRIGRQTNAKTVPTTSNGFFDSKVLSRQHAEIWADRNGKIWIRDVKSSNGTFVNGVRLSPENRDSEPHELREQDTLELGIDIVSEDQKSIVHHKVSAKVEHAGVYATGTSVLDLNFGDIDPSSGMGQSMGHGMQQLRGRGASQPSTVGNGRMTGPSSMGNGIPTGMAQRQLNLWMNPITIEHVVKRLTTELKQAKQQSQDLHRTSDFFTTLLSLAPGEAMPKSPIKKEPMDTRQPNGISPVAPHLEVLSPFSQPPAPPPQQPLPEKPDSARFTNSDSTSHFPLRRTETERPKSFSMSPTRPEPPTSQILALVEALNTAKKEIDSQGDRVKQLETLLKRERKARESAEERARRFMTSQHIPEDGREARSPEHDAFRSISESSDHISQEHASEVSSLSSDDDSVTTITASQNPDEIHRQTKNVDASTTRLQERLDQMVQDMGQMKAQMESYRRRAEGAEAERTSLADMIEQIRADTGRKENSMGNGSILHPFKRTVGKDAADASASATDSPQSSTSGLWNGTSSSSSPSSSTSSLKNLKQPNGTVISSDTTADRGPSSNLRGLERSMAAAFQSAITTAPSGGGGGRDVALQSAPYVSMVGVVLIGVGIMTWLNGWQKVER